LSQYGDNLRRPWGRTKILQGLLIEAEERNSTTAKKITSLEGDQASPEEGRRKLRKWKETAIFLSLGRDGQNDLSSFCGFPNKGGLGSQCYPRIRMGRAGARERRKLSVSLPVIIKENLN